MSPDFPPTDNKTAAIHMIQGLVTASAYFECTEVSRKIVQEMVVQAWPNNLWAQKAALIWFDALTSEYENDDRLVKVASIPEKDPQ